MTLYDLLDQNKWNAFLQEKLSKDFIPQKEKEDFSDFIKNQRYLPICSQMANDSYSFSIPHKHLISKGHSGKKRAVYTFSHDEMMVLKYLSYLLYDYDDLFSPNLYSFRKSTGVKSAIHHISRIKNIRHMYGYKVDIQNYFNSVDVSILLPKLKAAIDYESLYDLFASILSNPKVEYNGQILEEQKGVMAGVPLSAFFANFYLREIDAFFWQQKLVYFRYADDIILFCNTKEECELYQKILKEKIEEFHLKINPEKEYFFDPGDTWEFLGFSFDGKNIDLSANTIRKIKGKIRRSARGIRRWMLKKNATYEVALKAMNRKYNRKFFGKQEKEELSWKYWFFPTITTAESLKIIDQYLQESLRYIVTRKALQEKL